LEAVPAVEAAGPVVGLLGLEEDAQDARSPAGVEQLGQRRGAEPAAAVTGADEDFVEHRLPPTRLQAVTPAQDGISSLLGLARRLPVPAGSPCPASSSPCPARTTPHGRSYSVDSTTNEEEGLLPDEERKNWTTEHLDAPMTSLTSVGASSPRTGHHEDRCPF